MKRHHLILPLLLAAVAGGLWRLEHHAGLRRHAEDLRRDAAARAAELVLARGEVAALELEVGRSRAGARLALGGPWVEGSGTTPGGEGSGAVPDATRPPAGWPCWNPDSPYVWLSKELLPALLPEPFKAGGTVEGGMLDVLVVSPREAESLNRAARDIVEELRRHQTDRAEELPEHPESIAKLDDPRRTLRVSSDPEVRDALRRRLRESVVAALGAERGDLLLRAGAGWIEEEFGGEGERPRTYSVGRAADGVWTVLVQTPHGTMGASAAGALSGQLRQLPPHLRSRFEDLEAPLGAQPGGR